MHGETNLALGKLVEMSSQYGPENAGSKAVDGKISGDWYDKDKGGCASTKNTENPWMLVDLGVVSFIKKIKIYNRRDCCRKFNIIMTGADTESCVRGGPTLTTLFIRGRRLKIRL